MEERALTLFLKREFGRINKSSVENLVPMPNDDESLSDEDVPMENFKIYSNPLFDDEEIISPKIDPHYFNAESNLIESLLNRDILIDSSPKFDYLLEEFSGELAHIDPIPPGIEKADFDLEEEIRLVENLLYDNSSPRPPEELNLEIADTILESLSPSPILVEDSDSHLEEIDLFLATNDSMPPGIEDDDYDSEGDIRFLEELLNNDSLPLPENKSSNLDHFNDPLPSRPPPKPLDVEFCFDFEPDTGVVTTKVVKGISEHYVLMPNIFPTLPTLDPDSDFAPSYDSLGFGNKIFDPGIFIGIQSERLLSRDEFSISFIRDPLSLVFDTLLPFSFENEDKVFNPGILIYPLLSYRDEITSNFYKSPMMISGGDIPYLDVSIPQDHEDPYLFSILQSSGLRSGKANKSWPFIYLGACSDHLNRRIKLGELWDCQLGNLTAGVSLVEGEERDYPGFNGGYGITRGWLTREGFGGKNGREKPKKVFRATAFSEKTMSSPNHSTSDIEDAFSSMNILNYTSVSSDYFPASSGSSSFNSSENSKDNMIPPVFSPFYNNPYLKDVQAFYAKESPVSPPAPITPQTVLTPSPVLPPSLLFNL
ncbi:hypothetical protein Tco_0537949 [Tanacetum coccineum]